MLESYIDLCVAIYLILYFLSGLRRNLAHMFSALLGMVLALGLAFYAYAPAAALLAAEFNIASGFAKPLAFFLSVIVIKFLFAYGLTKLIRWPETTFQPASPFLKRFLSAVLSLAYGTLAALIIFSSIVSLGLPALITRHLEGSYFVALAQSDRLGINGRLGDIFGEVYPTALDNLGFLKQESGTTEKRDLGFKLNEVTIDDASEDRLLSLVNETRAAIGLKTLTMDEEARRCARDYGRYLFANGMFSHYDLEGDGAEDRMARYDTQFAMIGENLAYVPSVEDAHRGLMNSKEHRDNILNPDFSRVGIGVVDAGSYGKIFVQEFLD